MIPGITNNNEHANTMIPTNIFATSICNHFSLIVLIISSVLNLPVLTNVNRYLIYPADKNALISVDAVDPRLTVTFTESLE